jgi:hypothetical protein
LAISNSNFFIAKNGIAVGNTTNNFGVVDNQGYWIGKPFPVETYANLAFNQANTATATANYAYSQANTATSLAQSSYDSGNSTLYFAAVGYDKANSANVLAQAAYNYANTISFGTSSGFPIVDLGLLTEELTTQVDFGGLV